MHIRMKTSGGTNPAVGGGSQSFGDWYTQYAAQQRQEEGNGDIESGLLGNVGRFFRDRGLGDAHDQVSGFADRFITSIRGDGEGNGGLVGGAKATVESTLNYGARLRGFVALLLVGILFYLLAFFVGLPVIVFRPAKFALSATLGSLCTMGSFSVLVGPRVHLQSLLVWERLPFAVAYLGSLVLTLYASLILRSYLWVVASTGFQIGAFVWYLLAFLPGGPAGLRVLGGVMVRGVMGCGKTLTWCLSILVS
ncbi:hypothetical protein NGA_0223902 [Nannochloropsis gaditana CCMP526]|uniref:uncharacterized protein n=1 Tax=Nannochloropsis gaditana (strain CCMP526) TaxID=1093141 RepID=UPI00029F723D|nr:hypothetical protein NGA_0223902 [Nannochloropsis gaditana CCMP526]XP_005854692.1 hypothetical protein NGA_0223901 [Nannochloropsis gaditana CCMP526]EKU21666.1 hypothetical protein NGA_0223901 [Nannochloropsis gaditana CCMP526]EKU22343.1 hypothetical protein NGA_0223902 [Nannochloropsis gaditana CCMP526]|eukprot:XP_005854014.1 hypothetical protein NGA_0223902 [Nannochloropsis gaditana CCMP526]